MNFAALNLLLMAGVAFGQIWPLDMKEDCVDDQCNGPKEEILPLVDKSFRQKRDSDKDFKESWTKGQHNCKKGNEVGLNESIALYVYTYSGVKNLNIHKDFNVATRTGKEDYKAGTYQWYFFHYWLTKALQALKKHQTRCLTTYRGVNGQFTDESTQIRFGAFTSTSTDQNVAKGYGTISCFETYTCYGANIVEYSADKREKEVLIPPYETFEIAEVLQRSDKPDLWCETVYVLKSNGNVLKSNVNVLTTNGTKNQSLCVASVCLIIMLAMTMIMTMSYTEILL